MKRLAWIVAVAAVAVAAGCMSMTPRQQGTTSGAAVGAVAGGVAGNIRGGRQ